MFTIPIWGPKSLSAICHRFDSFSFNNRKSFLYWFRLISRKRKLACHTEVFSSSDLRCLRLVILLIQICHCHSIQLYFSLCLCLRLPSESELDDTKGGSPKMKKSCHIMWEKREKIFISSSPSSSHIFCILDCHKEAMSGLRIVLGNGTHFMHCWHRDISDVLRWFVLISTQTDDVKKIISSSNGESSEFYLVRAWST